MSLSRLDGLDDDDLSAIVPSDFAELVENQRRFIRDVHEHADANGFDRRRYRKAIQRRGEEAADAIFLLLKLWHPPHFGEWPN